MCSQVKKPACHFPMAWHANPSPAKWSAIVGMLVGRPAGCPDQMTWVESNSTAVNAPPTPQQGGPSPQPTPQRQQAPLSAACCIAAASANGAAQLVAVEEHTGLVLQAEAHGVHSAQN